MAQRARDVLGVLMVLVFIVAMVAGCGGASSTSSPTAPSESAAASGGQLSTGPALTTKPMAAADAARLDASIKSLMSTEASELDALWIGIWDPRQGVHEKAFGDAVHGGAAATLDDHVQIGSVTKTFTVTAVLEQVAAGKLSLDATINDELPDLATKYPAIADVTVRQLSGMQSPIQDYVNSDIASKTLVADHTHLFTADELIDEGMSLPLVTPDKYDYSNTNAIILGEMLEKLTGKPVDQVVTDIAKQVGMDQSALPPPAQQTTLPAPSAHGYVDSTTALSLGGIGVTIPSGTDVTDWSLSVAGARGAMYSTIADLGKWAASGLGTSLLPTDLARQRFVTHKIAAAGDYGLGIVDFGNGWIGHTGRTLGFEALVVYNRNTGAAVVAAVNNGGDLTPVAKKIAIGQFKDLSGLGGG
jgi:D-alanyl-D-alanine carboxypeptidase